MKLNKNEIKIIIKESNTRTDNKLDFIKIKEYLIERLNQKYTIQEFCKSLMDELENIFKELYNSLDDNNLFEKGNKELNYFYKAVDIFIYFPYSCSPKDAENIVNKKNINNFLEKFFKIFGKIASHEEEYKNNKNRYSIITQICQNIYLINKVFLTVNLKYTLQSIFFENKFFQILKNHFSRVFLYDGLKIAIKRNQNEFFKGKESIIKEIINRLIEETKSNKFIIIFEDIKKFCLAMKTHIIVVNEELIRLLKKIVDLFSVENKNEYDNLFHFFFNEIVFIEIIDKKSKVRYNEQFLNILFEIYDYLVKNKKKDLYDIFLIQLFDSISCENGKVKNFTNAVIKYKWLSRETKYFDIIVNSFPEIFNENYFTHYLMLLISLINDAKEDSKEKNFLPEKDLVLFFKNLKKYLNNNNYDKEYLINSFMKKISSLMNKSNDITRIILKKCNPLDILINLIESENNYNLKFKLFDFIEKILSTAGGKYLYTLNISIREKTDEINMKYNLISVGYELDDNKYNDKLFQLIGIMNKYLGKKEINNILKFVNLIFTVITDYKLKEINILDDDLILHLNKLLLQVSTMFSNVPKDKNFESNLEELIIYFLNTIFKFLFQFNMKRFEYKEKRKKEINPLYFTKRIIDKKILKNIIKNMLLTKINQTVKKITFEYLKNFSIDKNSNLIHSGYILYIIIKIYFQDENCDGLEKMFNILLDSIKLFPLNAKILLNHDFISITIDALQKIYLKKNKNNNEEECYKSGFLFLEEICKFLNQELLMKYINKIFIIFNKNVLNKIGEQKNIENENSSKFLERNNDKSLSDFCDIKDKERVNKGFKNSKNIDVGNNLEESELKIIQEEKNNLNIINDTENNKSNNSEICLELLKLLKKHLKRYKEITNKFINNNNSNYIILSNSAFPNHLINNIILINNLKYNGNDKYIYFRLVIKINAYNGLSEFILLKLRSSKAKIVFLVDKNVLEIFEESSEKKIITLYTIKDFDKLLPSDNKYHNCIIIFNVEEKTISMEIDDHQIIEKSKKYNTFNFDLFNMSIGFNNEIVNDVNNDIILKLSQNKINDEINKENNTNCYIYISYLIILNTIIENQQFQDLIKKEKDFCPNGNLLSRFNREKNKNYAKNVILEIDFQNKNIGITHLKEVQKKMKYGDNLIYINKYISYIEHNNFLSDGDRKVYLYMISKNANIYEYYSLNYFFELERINKSKISSKIFDNYDIIFNFCNIYIFDFLIGFLFLIEKRINDMQKKDIDDKNNENKNNTGESTNLYGENSISNRNIILIDYILEIFEILTLIPGENIKNYFLKGDSRSNIIKIKYFFYRKISLLNNNEIIIEKILNIFSFGKDNKGISNQHIPFLEILIEVFLNLIIFEKLSSKNQINILSYLYDFLEKYNFKENKNKHIDYLYKIIRNLVIISIYTKAIYEENFGKTKLDYISKSINIIITSTLPSWEENYVKKMKKFFNIINGFCINFQKDIKLHSDFFKEHFDKIKYAFPTYKNEEKFENNISIISQKLQNFYNLIIKNEKISPFLDNNSEIVECYLCSFLQYLFNLKSNFIFDEFTYDKLYIRFFRNYYLNFGENAEIFGNTKYVWNLSLKESYCKIQNKLFLKENHVKYISSDNPDTQNIINYFIYDCEKEKNEKKFKDLFNLSCIDKICKHKHLLKVISQCKSFKYAYNCLIINKLHKILSTIILNDDYLIIFYNICLDNENKINIVKSETSHSLWAKNKEEYKKELAEFLSKNEEEIKKDILEKKNENVPINKKWVKFGYDKSYKFSKRVLYLNKINEIYKSQHLHISNSIEIFMNNGESYFIVLNPENRDALFDQILNGINNIYKEKENKLEIYKLSRLTTSINKENILYLKHYPISNYTQDLEAFIKGHKLQSSASNTNIRIYHNLKIVLEENSLKDEICNEWSKNKITNYDYLMLLNTLGGRSLNHLSQYYIFPWIIKDFNCDILNWLSDKIYRDLSLPIHACGRDLKMIINKYDITDEERYHSGTFYSTHSFVCYFLIRQKPYTDIHLEIQGGRFDSQTRMFKGVDQLSNLGEKYQELIPALFNFPELYIKTNYTFEDNVNLEEPIDEYKFPKWSTNDPRKFSLILRKLLESDKISQKLNLWIDLIFGYKQKGQHALKALNTFRPACYPFPKNKLETLENNKELESNFYEKEEMGVIGKQLFNKSHKKKEIFENKKNKIIFFNHNDKIKNLVIQKIKNKYYKKLVRESKEISDNKEKNENNDSLSFDDISDIIFSINSPLSRHKPNTYQGGISSLESIMSTLEESHTKYMDINKIIKILEEEKNFIILNKSYKYLKNSNLFLTYNTKCIEITKICENESYKYSFFLNEIGDISCLTMNEKGTKLYVGFTNGKINEYKIIRKLQFKMDNDEANYIIPSNTEVDKTWSEYQNIFKTEENLSNFFPFKENNNFRIYLKPITINFFSYNNPHIPRKINILSLNEYHQVLIALDESNFIYIISLNNNYKLMNISRFLSNIHCKMKEILPLSWNGDFFIYSSYTINLFSINGVPLCQLNLFEKIYENMYSITCCKAFFLYDIILFTAHKDGTLVIWKIKNKNVSEKFDERISYIFNDKKSKAFLPEYAYGFNIKNIRYNKFKITDYELQRKFEIINIINDYQKTNTYFNFMKMSTDLDYMILMDNQKNLFILSTQNEKTKKNIPKSKNKDRCYNCNKKLIDVGIRATLIDPHFLDNLNENNFSESENVENDNINENSKSDSNIEKFICEECKQILIHTENYLYI